MRPRMYDVMLDTHSMSAARIYLGALLALMALGQLASLGSFVEAIEDYDAGRALAPALAALLIALELAGATGLLSPVRPALRLAAARAGLGAAVLWSLLALQALARGLELDNCGCFGRFLGQPLTIWVVPQDAIFVALAVFVVRAAGATRRGTS